MERRLTLARWCGCPLRTAQHFATISQELAFSYVGTSPPATGWCFWRVGDSATTLRVATEDSL